MVDLKKLKKAHKEKENQRKEIRKNRVKYSVVKSNGEVTDVRLKFGIWSGYRITDMINDPIGVNYITNFILAKESDFPKKFKNMVRKIFDTHYTDFLTNDDVLY